MGWLREKFDCLTFSSVLDAFGGTASVSLLLAQMGKKVTYHDSFAFNYFSANALLSSQESKLSRNDFICILSSIREKRGFISRNFCGLYYTDKENSWLDGALSAIAKIGLTGIELDVFRYCLFQACLQKRPYNMFHRANLAMRTSTDVHRSFGNTTTWERSFSELMIRAYDELFRARACAKSATAIMPPTRVMDIEQGYDLVYLDPPYLRKKSPERYLNRYHFLEGLAKYDLWPKLVDRKNPCMSFKKGYLAEDWEDSKKSESMIEDVVIKHRRSIVALSYMEGGIPSIRNLTRIFEGNFSRFEIHSTPACYALSKSTNTEVLIVGSPV